MFTLKTVSQYQTLNNVTSTTVTLDQLPVLKVTYERQNNDVYGNPIYRVVVSGGDNPELTYVYPGLHRRYRSKGYATIQSYNIEQTITDVLVYLQVIAHPDSDHYIVPHFLVNYKGERSFEFSLMDYDHNYIEDEQDGQDYDTFRVFKDGTVKGTMTNDYYVYDEVVLPVDTKEVYRLIAEHIKYVPLDDQSANAIQNYEDDEWEN